jgi:chromosome segregation ATPase
VNVRTLKIALWGLGALLIAVSLEADDPQDRVKFDRIRQDLSSQAAELAAQRDELVAGSQKLEDERTHLESRLAELTASGRQEELEEVALRIKQVESAAQELRAAIAQAEERRALVEAEFKNQREVEERAFIDEVALAERERARALEALLAEGQDRESILRQHLEAAQQKLEEAVRSGNEEVANVIRAKLKEVMAQLEGGRKEGEDRLAAVKEKLAEGAKRLEELVTAGQMEEAAKLKSHLAELQQALADERSVKLKKKPATKEGMDVSDALKKAMSEGRIDDVRKLLLLAEKEAAPKKVGVKLMEARKKKPSEFDERIHNMITAVESLKAAGLVELAQQVEERIADFKAESAVKQPAEGMEVREAIAQLREQVADLSRAVQELRERLEKE